MLTKTDFTHTENKTSKPQKMRIHDPKIHRNTNTFKTKENTENSKQVYAKERNCFMKREHTNIHGRAQTHTHTHTHRRAPGGPGAGAPQKRVFALGFQGVHRNHRLGIELVRLVRAVAEK